MLYIGDTVMMGYHAVHRKQSYDGFYHAELRRHSYGGFYHAVLKRHSYDGLSCCT